MNVNPQKFINNESAYEILKPKGFRRLVGEKKPLFIQKHRFILNKKFDPYEDITIFKDGERVFIIKTYPEIMKIKKHSLIRGAKKFEKLFNEKMKKNKQNYRVYFEKAKVKQNNGRTFYLFYGKGDYFINNCAFIQAVTYYKKDKTFIMYGILKKADEEYLDNVFLKSILSLKPYEKKESGIFSVYPFSQKWFRYLLLFAVAVAVTVLYNKYTKRGEPVFGKKKNK